MRVLQRFVLFLLCVGAGVSIVFAQSLGDYGSVQSGNWGTVATWRMYSTTGWDSAATVQPPSTKSVYILTGTTVTLEASAKTCKNLYIQTGATLQGDSTYPFSTGIRYVRVYGPNMVTDGTFGGVANNGSIEWYGNVTFTGSGTLSPCRMRPGTNIKNITATIDQDMTLTYVGGSGTGGMGLYTSNSGNDSITVTINAGRTVTGVNYCYFGTTSSTSTNSAIKSWFNINGTLTLGGTNSTLSLRTQSPGATEMNVNGTVNVSRNFYPTGTTGYTSTVTIGSGGAMTVGTGGTGGTCDFATPAQIVTGAGTFAVASGVTLNIGSPAGLDPATGQIQTGTRSFNQYARYAYVGTSAQVTGPDLPTALNYLIINNPAGVTLTTGVVTDTLSMTSGVLHAGSTYFGAVTVNGAINGGGAGAFIDGLLYKSVGEGVVQSFHLGTDTTYLPITLRPGTEGGSGFFGMQVLDEGVIPLSVPTGATHLKHYYSLVHSGTLSSTFDTVVVHYSAADVQAAGIPPSWLGAALLQGGTWVPLTVSEHDTAARTITLTGVPSIGDILIGQFVPVADFRSRAVAFDSVLVLSTKKDSVTVLNPGIDTLKINVGVVSDTAVTVTPSSATVLAGDSVKFYFTYAPKSTSALAGTVQFVSNTPLGYDTLSVTGAGKLYTIADVRTFPSGTLVAFSGVVTRVLGRYTYLQQDTSGYVVYQSSGSLFSAVNAGTVKKGDVLIINGNTTLYNQLQEISGSGLKAWAKTGTGVVPQPVAVTLAQIRADGNIYESRLISVKNAKFVNTADLVFVASRSYTAIDSSDTTKGTVLRIGGATDTYLDGMPVPTQLFNFTGPLGQYSSVADTGFQLMPIDSADIEALYGGALYSRKTVAFDSLLAGLSKTDSIVVLSTGSLPLAISVSSISDTTFKVAPSSATVPIGDSVKFYITFAPLMPADFSANIVFTVNSAQKFDTVQAAGKGYVYTLAQVRRMPVGSLVAFGGVVTRTRGSYTYMQDDSAGIMLYQGSGSLKDSIASGFVKKGMLLGVNGVTSLYNSLLEIADVRVWVPIGMDTLPAPIPLTLAEIAANGAQYQARLIKVVNLEVRDTADSVWSQGATYKTYSIVDPGDTTKAVTLRIGRSTDTYVWGLKIPTEPFTFTGALGQYSSNPATGFQLMPVDTNDIKAGFVVGVDEPVIETIPAVYALEQNYPNPFNPSTRIEFSLPKQSNVELRVYNVIGQEVATLIDQPMDAGRHVVTFDARSLASGLYFYRILAGEFTSVRKMVLVK